MAEFCKECFLKLNPQYTEDQLEIIKERDLCEGCGKIVEETVLRVKEKSNEVKNRSNNLW